MRLFDTTYTFGEDLVFLSKTGELIHKNEDGSLIHITDVQTKEPVTLNEMEPHVYIVLNKGGIFDRHILISEYHPLYNFGLIEAVFDETYNFTPNKYFGRFISNFTNRLYALEQNMLGHKPAFYRH